MHEAKAVNEALGMSAPESDCPEGFEQRVMQRLKVECAAPWSALPADATTATGPQGGWPLFWLRLGPVFCGLSVVMTFVAPSTRRMRQAVASVM